MERHYFPGGNTSKGFVSHFDGIIPSWGVNRRLYVLKGGPGVGKNTFMNLLGSQAVSHGLDVEYFHCASDGDSLDAVRIPKLGITMLDGTAPHVIDPVTPGAVDGIINLGIYLNEKALENSTEEIQSLFAENSKGYRRTFAYLGAAGKLCENTNEIYREVTKEKGLKEALNKILSGEEKPISENPCLPRRLFAEAITPKGNIDWMGSISFGVKTLRLDGPRAVASLLLQHCIQAADYYGWTYERFDSPLLPDQPEHLIIHEKNLCITTSSMLGREPEDTLDLSALIDKTGLSKNQQILSENEQECNTLMKTAINSLEKTKGIHDQLETIYKACMDFESLTIFTNRFLSELF
jgi:hypothetical protein